jgi:nucleoside-triphosphatase THEP1
LKEQIRKGRMNVNKEDMKEITAHSISMALSSDDVEECN